MSAPITEAHKQTAAKVAATRSLLPAAQLIADSEAKAVDQARNARNASQRLDYEKVVEIGKENDQLRAEIVQLQKNCTDIYDAGRKTEDQLRAVFPKICAALGNGAWCAPDVSLEFLQSIPNEVACVVTQLRAEIARLDTEKPWLKEIKEMVASLSAALAESRAEVERLSKAPAEKSCGELSCDECDARTAELVARAERAEAAIVREMDQRNDAVSERITQQDRAELAETELREISAEKLRWTLLAIARGDEAQRAEADARRERITWEAVAQRASDLATSLEEAEAELATERVKVRALRDALKSIRPLTIGTRRASNYSQTHKSERFDTAETDLIDEALAATEETA